MSHEIRQLENSAQPPPYSHSESRGPSAAEARTLASGTSPLPSALSAAPDPMSLLKALRRRLWLAVGLGVLAAAVVGGVAWFVVPESEYTARAVLHVAAEPPQILFKTLETENAGRDEYGRYQKTQVAWVKSRFVIKTALQEPGVDKLSIIRKRDDPIHWLQNNLSVGFKSGSELLEIGLSGDYPEELASLVNTIKAVYIDEVVNREHKRRLERFDRLKTLKEQYAETLKTKRQNLRKLAESAGSNDRETLALKQQFALEHQAAIQKELLEVQSERRKVEAELEAMGQDVDADPEAEPQITEAEIWMAIEADPSVAQLRGQLAEAEAEWKRAVEHLKRVSRNYRTDPSLRRYHNAVEHAQQALAERRRELRPLVIQRLRQSDRPRSRADEVRQQRVMLQDLESRLESELEQFKEGTRELNVNTLDLQAVQDEIEQIESTADTIAKEVEALNVELQAPKRVTTLEDAVAPRDKDEKKRYMMIAMATLGAFGASLLGVSFLEFQTRKVNSADEVALGLGMPLVGSLPTVPSRIRHGLSSEHSKGRDRYWQNLLLESINATRTMVLHAARTESHQTLMVTSALGGEGKTSLSCHLAIGLARAGRKTLLIDGDLRRPRIDHLFDLPPVPGLGEVLRGQVTVEQAIATTTVEQLDIIPAGQYDEQASRALSLGQAGPVFARLREQYDFVIIDSSPVLPIADAQLIAQHADAVLFSIMRDVSRVPKVYAACQRLASLGVPILGAVVSGDHGGLYGTDYDYPARTTSPEAAKPELSTEPGESS